MKLTFTKGERLSAKSSIEGLFRGGSSFFNYPYRVVYLLVDKSDSLHPAQALVSVPKKKFRSAVARNRIKRKVKEAYRLQKNSLLYPHLNKEQQVLHVAFQYVANKDLPFDILAKGMEGVLKKLANESTR